MKKKRERLEVIHDILYTIQSKQEIGPTRLLQLSNLSPKMFKDYLNELTEKELIEEKITNKKKKFSLTIKGHEFIQKYKQFLNFVTQLNL
jgi:predicted transcriptional regulator